MTNKEIKITVPDGYEIDKENSTFECIKFKKKSALDYRQVLIELTKGQGTYLYMNERGNMFRSNAWGHVDSVFTMLDERQAKQLFALNKLMNVAAYLNEKTLDWKDDIQVKWYIYYNHPNKTLGVGAGSCIQSSHVYFDSEEHAKQAIEILGKDTIKKALGVFE